MGEPIEDQKGLMQQTGEYLLAPVVLTACSLVLLLVREVHEDMGQIWIFGT